MLMYKGSNQRSQGRRPDVALHAAPPRPAPLSPRPFRSRKALPKFHDSLRWSLQAAVVARRASRVLASVRDECRIIDKDGISGNPNFWLTSTMSGVANRRGKAAAARPADRAAVTAGVVPTHTSVHGICTPSSRRNDSPTRCSKSADANQPKCSGPRTSPSRRSSSLRTMTASSPPLHRRPTRRGSYRPAPRSSDRDPSFSASLAGSEPPVPHMSVVSYARA